MTTAHEGIPTGVHVVLRRGPEVMLMRRHRTGFFDGLFSLPGGHVEPGEQVVEAACRELLEEVGVGIEPAALRWLGVVHRLSDSNRIDFFFEAHEWSGSPEIREPEKCDRLGWFNTNALPTGIVPYVRSALERAADAPWMMELGWSGV